MVNFHSSLDNTGDQPRKVHVRGSRYKILPVITIGTTHRHLVGLSDWLFTSPSWLFTSPFWLFTSPLGLFTSPFWLFTSPWKYVYKFISFKTLYSQTLLFIHFPQSLYQHLNIISKFIPNSMEAIKLSQLLIT